MATIVAEALALCPDIDANAVKEIISTDLTDAEINNFINMAYYVVIPLTGELGDCGGLGAQCEIMKVLAAHFITMYERQIKQESVAGEWSVTYLGKGELGLDASLYGQQAKVLDCSGTLAKAGMLGVMFQVADYEQLGDLPEDT